MANMVILALPPGITISAVLFLRFFRGNRLMAMVNFMCHFGEARGVFRQLPL